jgi:hypothetical protein
VGTVQNQANHGHKAYDQTQDNDNAQSVGFSFLLVIARIDGVQQMVDVAPVDIAYVKLHAAFSAQIGPSRRRKPWLFEGVAAMARPGNRFCR